LGEKQGSVNTRTCEALAHLLTEAPIAKVREHQHG
jgi:hypothetical protein